MGEAQDHLLKLASVAGYKRTSKNGKVVYVRAYTSSVRAAVDKFVTQMKDAGGPGGRGWFTEGEARTFAKQHKIEPEKFLGALRNKNHGLEERSKPKSADEAQVQQIKDTQASTKRAKDAAQGAALEVARLPKPGWNARSSQGGLRHVDDPIVADHDPTLHKTPRRLDPKGDLVAQWKSGQASWNSKGQDDYGKEALSLMTDAQLQEARDHTKSNLAKGAGMSPALDLRLIDKEVEKRKKPAGSGIQEMGGTSGVPKNTGTGFKYKAPKGFKYKAPQGFKAHFTQMTGGFGLSETGSAQAKLLRLAGLETEGEES